ncbi:hypothetical protein AOZ06_28380 [Kibdelosporangium phytohabitans]|uniref:Uncharacterized protein n=1 Tax=Kibdelosporangium phytohabitans TaxID=860235 RepID=A0A0N9I2N6_9PSEU|nr:hypothetical protein AOZ06_28380 [Kibdelosporangium phytohabitans]
MQAVEPDAVVAGPKRRWGMLLSGFVAGVVVGTGAVGLTWASTGSGGDPAAGVDGDAATACSLVRRTGSMSAGSQLDFDQFGRWSSASALMQSASHDNVRYKPLANALARTVEIVAATYKAEGAEFEEHVRQARALCAGL